MTLPTPDTTSRTPLPDAVARGAENAVNSARRTAHGAVDEIGEQWRDLRDAANPAIDRAADQVADLSRRGADALSRRARGLSDSARERTDTLRHYVQDEPVKSVLIAAAAGMVLATLVRLLAPRH